MDQAKWTPRGPWRKSRKRNADWSPTSILAQKFQCPAGSHGILQRLHCVNNLAILFCFLPVLSFRLVSPSQPSFRRSTLSYRILRFLQRLLRCLNSCNVHLILFSISSPSWSPFGKSQVSYRILIHPSAAPLINNTTLTVINFLLSVKVFGKLSFLNILSRESQVSYRNPPYSSTYPSRRVTTLATY